MNTPRERLEIAKLISFDIVGDVSADGNKGTTERRIKIAKKSKIKMAGFLRNTNKKFRFYMIAHNRYGGNWYPSSILTFNQLEKFIDTSEIRKDSDAINVIIVGRGLGKEDLNSYHAPTPWIIVHMMCHELYDSKPQLHSDLFEYWREMLDGVYPGSIFKQFAQHQYMVTVQEKFFTFRSARKKKILSPDEGLIDFMVHIINTGGQVEVNELPSSIYIHEHVDKKYYHLSKDADNYINQFIIKSVRYVYDELNNATGKYIMAL